MIFFLSLGVKLHRSQEYEQGVKIWISPFPLVVPSSLPEEIEHQGWAGAPTRRPWPRELVRIRYMCEEPLFNYVIQKRIYWLI